MSDRTPDQPKRSITEELAALGWSIEQMDAQSHSEQEAERIIRDRIPPPRQNGHAPAQPHAGDDELLELPGAIRDGIAMWRRQIVHRKGSAEDILSYAARDLFGMLKVNATAYPHLHDQSHQAVVDELQELGAFAGIDDAEIQRIMTDGKRAADDPSSASRIQRGDAAPKWQSGGIGQDAAGTIRESSATPFAFNPQPYQFPDPVTIPKRQWLYGRHYMPGVVSATLGAPGRLKSTTLLTEMVGMSAGRDLLGGKPLDSGMLRAAYFNGEETQDELDRRVAAIMQCYKIKPEDCEGRLWVVSTRDTPIRFAIMGPKGNAVTAHDAVDAVAAWCDARSIDVFSADPLVSFHLVRENDPGDMDMLYKEGFGRIAGKERRAVDLAIHPRKPPPGDINTSISDLRGTGAQEAALR